MSSFLNMDCWFALLLHGSANPLTSPLVSCSMCFDVVAQISLGPGFCFVCGQPYGGGGGSVGFAELRVGGVQQPPLSRGVRLYAQSGVHCSFVLPTHAYLPLSLFMLS